MVHLKHLLMLKNLMFIYLSRHLILAEMMSVDHMGNSVIQIGRFFVDISGRQKFSQVIYLYSIQSFSGLAKSCIGLRSKLIKMGTRKNLYAACDDLDHFASIQFHSVACLYVYGRFLVSFLVAQNNPLVRFDLACRSDARHSDNWPALLLYHFIQYSPLCDGLQLLQIWPSSQIFDHMGSHTLGATVI